MTLDSYIICGTPRTGSTLLCDLLAKTNRAGRPDSFYGGAFRGDWAKEWKLPEPGTMDRAAYERLYLDTAIRKGTGDTPIFGLRLMREDVANLSDLLNLVYPGFSADSARFERAFGRCLYIHLNRADKLAQAVSYIKARQSGLWHIAPDGTEIERLGEPQPLRYDYGQIRAETKRLEAFEQDWQAWFEAENIRPIRISYEALALEPASTLIDLCAALGIEPPGRTEIMPGVAPLADAINADWIARYRAENGC